LRKQTACASSGKFDRTAIGDTTVCFTLTLLIYLDKKRLCRHNDPTE